jgi:hypothetical protein
MGSFACRLYYQYVAARRSEAGKGAQEMLSNDPVKVLAACPVQVRYLSFDAFEPGMILGEPITLAEHGIVRIDAVSHVVASYF